MHDSYPLYLRSRPLSTSWWVRTALSITLCGSDSHRCVLFWMSVTTRQVPEPTPGCRTYEVRAE